MSVMSDIDLDRREYGIYHKAFERDLPKRPDPYALTSVYRPKRPVQYDNNNIVMFMRMISVIPTEATNFAQSFRIITMQNKSPKKRWHQKWADIDAVYQGYYTNPKGVEFTPNYDDVINSIKFYRDKDYYVTKNSFKAKHKTKLNAKTKEKESQLFSLDNIVIDVDSHKTDKNGHELQLTAKDAEAIDTEILKLFRLLYCRPKHLPNFNFAVKTGRGVQLWLRLESCYAPLFQDLYRDVCSSICAELKALLEANDIDLDVDFATSCDATRSVRLPYTHNSKRKGYVTELVPLILGKKTLLQQVSLQALAAMYGLTITKYQKQQQKRVQQDKANKQCKRQTATEDRPTHQAVSFQPAAKRRMLYLEWLVDNRNGDCTGSRDIILHHHFNAAFCCLPLADAENRTYALNEKFRDPLSRKDIKEQIIRPIRHTRDEKGYFYSTTRFLNEVGATASERLHFLENASARDSERQQAREAKQITNAMIIAYRNNGFTYQEIAEKTGKSLRTVKTICNPKAKLDKQERDTKILHLAAKGMSAPQIGKELGVSAPTVRKVLQQVHDKDQTQTGGYFPLRTCTQPRCTDKPESSAPHSPSLVVHSSERFHSDILTTQEENST